MLNLSESTHCMVAVIAVLVSVILAASKNCGSLDDCKKEETQKICAFDEEKPCFRILNNECERKYYGCTEKLALKISDQKFCEVDNFMCTKEYDAFSAAFSKKENILDYLLQIYRT